MRDQHHRCLELLAEVIVSRAAPEPRWSEGHGYHGALTHLAGELVRVFVDPLPE
ncbi:hypothetical protein LM599_01920 [Candidatus Acetothermia bacterium]|nr:hypothetical protein [Candidatus Acetothermia bacterium]